MGKMHGLLNMLLASHSLYCNHKTIEKIKTQKGKQNDFGSRSSSSPMWEQLSIISAAYATVCIQCFNWHDVKNRRRKKNNIEETKAWNINQEEGTEHKRKKNASTRGIDSSSPKHKQPNIQNKWNSIGFHFRSHFKLNVPTASSHSGMLNVIAVKLMGHTQPVVGESVAVCESCVCELCCVCGCCIWISRYGGFSHIHIIHLRLTYSYSFSSLHSTSSCLPSQPDCTCSFFFFWKLVRQPMWKSWWVVSKYKIHIHHVFILMFDIDIKNVNTNLSTCSVFTVYFFFFILYFSLFLFNIKYGLVWFVWRTVLIYGMAWE